MKTKLFLIIAMFLSGTGVLAEELPARGLAPVIKQHTRFFSNIWKISRTTYMLTTDQKDFSLRIFVKNMY